MNVVRKSIAYVTWRERILFFRADEAPWAGAELPGGTLLEDEAPETGVVREAVEETGLVGFGAPRLLGVVDFDPDNGKNEIHRRHFFHLPLLQAPPDAWSRVVEEGNGTFTFRFFWVDRSTLPTDVHPGHDRFIAEFFS